MSRSLSWTTLLALLVSSLWTASAFAQARDAASKIQGRIDSFDSARPRYSARMSRPMRVQAPAVVSTQPAAPAPNAVAQAPTVRRSFSAEAAPQPSQGVRRYSYEPQTSGGMRSMNRPRSLQSDAGIHRADWKVRGREL